jgi:hypothetical protein
LLISDDTGNAACEHAGEVTGWPTQFFGIDGSNRSHHTGLLLAPIGYHDYIAGRIGSDSEMNGNGLSFVRKTVDCFVAYIRKFELHLGAGYVEAETPLHICTGTLGGAFDEHRYTREW